MKALVFERNLARFAAVPAGVGRGGSGDERGRRAAAAHRLEAPELPGPGWHRVRPLLAGICGSDLATLDGRSSRYFEDIVSFPFVPGHEMVGEIVEVAPHATVTAPTRCRSAPGSWSSPCSAASPAASSHRARPVPRAGREDASGWPSGISPPGCRSASAPTPAGGGRRPASWPTASNSTRARRPLRRRRRHGRAHGLRRARRPGGRGRTGRHGGRARRRNPGAHHHGRPAPAGRARRAARGGASTPPAAPGRRARRRRGRRPRPAGPGRAAPRRARSSHSGT